MASPGEPLLSVVLPVGDVEHYLPACLDSILAQPGPAGGVEVIAVDDASRDASGAVLDARAAHDPRLRVIHLSDRAGPGPARARGLAAAGGRYVWFVDPDDLVAPAALMAVGDRLAAARPDVLMLDYRVLRPSGRTAVSPGASLLIAEDSAAAGPPGGVDAVTLRDRPDLINRTMTVWSKVFRRPFLAGLGVTFPPGVHEDVPVSAAALLSAERIATLAEVCYLYRQREGSFLATPSAAHFSVFTSYERVFTLMDAAAEPYPAAVRTAVFQRAIEHYSSILASGLVPAAARREYFARMAADFQRYRPPGYRAASGARGVKTALISNDAYWAYALLAPLNGARVALRRLLGR